VESHDAEFSEAGRGHVSAPKPSRFHATPAEIDAFLRHHFAEDTLLRYQWAIGDAAAHKAAEEQRDRLTPDESAAMKLRLINAGGQP
jgi:hypothetical protein